MGGGTGGNFGSTRGMKETIRVKIASLPKNPHDLISRGWQETTPEAMAKNTNSRTFRDKDTGLSIRFDKGINGIKGYGGKNHYHIRNPYSKGKWDYYLDKYGNPVPKNSKASHITV